MEFITYGVLEHMNDEQKPDPNHVLDYSKAEAPRWSIASVVAAVFAVFALALGALMLFSGLRWLLNASSQSTTADVLRFQDNGRRCLAIAAVLIVPGCWYGWRLLRRR